MSGGMRLDRILFDSEESIPRVEKAYSRFVDELVKIVGSNKSKALKIAFLMT